MEHRILYRWLLSAVLWAALLLSVTAAVRAANDAARVAGEIAPQIISPAQEQANAEARELARAFTVEWATWTGDEKEYQSRVGRFLRNLPSGAAPNGIQQVVSASVVGYGTADGGGSSAVKMKVLLHVRRLTPSGDKGGQAWVDILLPVDVPISVQNGVSRIAGLPVLAPMPVSAGQSAGSHLDYSAPPKLASFLRQFLDLYYAGGEIANFVASDSGVTPLGGWKLAAVGEMRVDDAEDPAAALVKVRVSGNGVEWLYQELRIGLRAAEGRYLVTGLSPAF